MKFKTPKSNPFYCNTEESFFLTLKMSEITWKTFVISKMIPKIFRLGPHAKLSLICESKTAQCWTSLHSVICSAYLSLSSLSSRILASGDSAIPHLPLSVNSSMLPWHLWKEDDSDAISLTSIFFVAIRVLCTVIYSLKKRGGNTVLLMIFVGTFRQKSDKPKCGSRR